MEKMEEAQATSTPLKGGAARQHYESDRSLDLTQKFKRYAAPRWKSWLKHCVIISGIFLVVCVIFVIIAVELKKRKEADTSAIPGLELISASDDISFNPDKERTYRTFLEHLEDFRQDYSQSPQNPPLDCSKPGVSATPDQGCHFDISSLYQECSSGDFGYSLGQPCILLKIKRVENWTPRAYTPFEKIPPHLINYWRQDHVYVTCQAENNEEEQSLSIKYLPNVALSTKYFPFTGQEDYQDPLIFVKFLDLPTGESTPVKCELWSSDISEKDRERMAVKFSVMVD